MLRTAAIVPVSFCIIAVGAETAASDRDDGGYRHRRALPAEQGRTKERGHEEDRLEHVREAVEAAGLRRAEG